MGHGHEEPYKIPDYKSFKVEDVPELVTTQRVLAAKGLSDPWLRNEVWRYKGFGTQWKRGFTHFFRGFGYGAVLTVATVALTAAYNKCYPSEGGHEHH